MATQTYSSFVGFFYNLNLIVGSGFLSIPYVLVKSGLATGLVTLLIISFVSGLTARWILETMYRGDVRLIIALALEVTCITWRV
jgi:amino acid permease